MNRWFGASACMIIFALTCAQSLAVTVRTVAGSGEFGIRDGAAPQATFMMPAGVAFDREGNLLVADAAANRIREISKGGDVRTMAGSGSSAGAGLWLRGGYLDGPAASAQFDHPTGLAVDREGNVYVADTFNHCIRRIDRSATVTTYAGSTQPGNTDGPRLSARFQRPTGISVDGRGDVFVADPGTGLRKISRAGNVSTIERPSGSENLALGVSTYDTAAGPVIFVAERFGLSVLQADGSVEHFRGGVAMDFDVAAPKFAADTLRLIEARKPLGFPVSLTALNEHTVAFVDPRTNTVRVLETTAHTLRILGGQPIEDASGDSGGFRDGPAIDSLFNAPIGIAHDGRGELFVADSGNRRIRALTGIDYRGAVAPSQGLLDADSGTRSDYHIAYIGNSAVWYNTGWNDSIEAYIENKLNSDHALRARNVRVIAMSGNEKLAATSQYSAWLARAGAVQLVVLNLNIANLIWSFGNGQVETMPPLEVWTKRLTAELSALRAELNRRGVPLVVVTTPGPVPLDLAESAYTALSVDLGNYMERGEPIQNAMDEAVRRSGAPLIELSPAFLDYEKKPDHAALFGGDDYHFSKTGRAVVGQAVGEALEKLAPWSTAP
ncbi:MAG: hypothetical protein DLM50_08835 [Candidatus Meridianibacter frigidus]|nr:MAG: hypothetical protein DLM50_08835 [Candidatus Eremiobacteraeota bacterium]